ncbi:hypothetical protein D3C76_1063810 [compost metagenome]
MPGAQVVDGKVDDFRNCRTFTENQQVQRSRQLHEAGNHPAVDRWQQRIADIVLAGRQAEQQVIALTAALDTNQSGIRDQLQQRFVIAFGMRLAQLLVHFWRDHWPLPLSLLAKLRPPLMPLPRRMKVPTTCAIGCSGSSW